MPKVNGPLMSQDASGTIANALNFRSTARGNVCARYGKPTGKPTANQTAQRERIAILAAAWTAASDNNHATWNAIATPKAITGYAAFIAYNCDRLTHGLSLSLVYPPATFATVTWATVADAYDPTGDYEPFTDPERIGSWGRITSPYAAFGWEPDADQYLLALQLTETDFALWCHATSIAGTYMPMYHATHSVIITLPG